MAKKALFFSFLVIASLAAAAITIKLTLLLKGESMFGAGDYYFEVDPVLLSFIEKPGLDVYKNMFPPLMTPLSLEVRAVVIWIFYNLGLVSSSDNPVVSPEAFNERYIIGSISIIALGYGALFFSLFSDNANKIKKALPLLILSIAVLAINPLSLSALNWSHPEEILLATLLAAGGISLLKNKYSLAAIFIGMAIATKQPAVFIFPAAFLFVEAGRRKKFTLISVASFLVLTVPWVVFGFRDFIDHNLLTASNQDFNIERGLEVFTGLGLRSIAEVGKPLIFLAAILIPLSAAKMNQNKSSWRLSDLQITGLQLAIIVPVVFFIRSVFDLGNISYYALPAGMSLILLDWVWQKNNSRFEKIPVTLPIATTAGSLFLSILFYRDISIDPVLRGAITATISIAIIGIALFYIYGKERILSLSKKSIQVAAGFIVASLALLALSHHILNNPDPTLQYENFKFYPIERIPLAIPDTQESYWLGDSVNQDITLIKQGLNPDIIFSRYSKKGELTSAFYYGNENTVSDLKVETFNKIPEKEKFFALRCLRKGICQGFTPYRSDIGPVFVKEEKEGLPGSWKTDKWRAIIISDKTEQMIKIENSGLPVSVPQVIKLLRPLVS